MTKKQFQMTEYTTPTLREVKTSIESGFVLSNNFGAESYEDGEQDWLS